MQQLDVNDVAGINAAATDTGTAIHAEGSDVPALLYKGKALYQG